MQIKEGNFCPLIKDDCVGLQCKWMIHVKGLHPQTGQEIDEWECSVKWLPLLMIETAKEVRQGAAATESFRNEMVKATEATINTMVAVADHQTRLLSSDMKLLEGKNASDNH